MGFVESYRSREQPRYLLPRRHYGGDQCCRDGEQDGVPSERNHDGVDERSAGVALEKEEAERRHAYSEYDDAYDEKRQ